MWPSLYACAQPYHPSSGSHGQPFRPYYDSSAWHSTRQGQDQCHCTELPLTAEADA